MLSQVKCVAFDAVGTVIKPDPPVVAVYTQIGNQHGSAITETQVANRFGQAFRAEYDSSNSTDEANERLIWRRIVERVFDDLSDPALEVCFEELHAHFGMPEAWRCFSDVEVVLSELKERGIDCVLASNFDQRLHAICEGHAELNGFSARFISSELGSYKPNPLYYQAMLKSLELNRDELLMVGDDWANDVNGAKAVGIPAVHLDRSQTEAVTWNENIPVINTLTTLWELLS